MAAGQHHPNGAALYARCRCCRGFWHWGRCCCFYCLQPSTNGIIAKQKLGFDLCDAEGIRHFTRSHNPARYAPSYDVITPLNANSITDSYLRCGQFLCGWRCGHWCCLDRNLWRGCVRSLGTTLHELNFPAFLVSGVLQNGFCIKRLCFLARHLYPGEVPSDRRGHIAIRIPDAVIYLQRLSDLVLIRVGRLILANILHARSVDVTVFGCCDYGCGWCRWCFGGGCRCCYDRRDRRNVTLRRKTRVYPQLFVNLGVGGEPLKVDDLLLELGNLGLGGALVLDHHAALFGKAGALGRALDGR